MACSVLRCSDPVSHVEHLRQEERLPVDIPFCAAHWALVEDGARWHVDYQHEAQMMVVLMGDDLPPSLEDLNVREHLGTEDVEATLTLTRGDGSSEVHTFVIPRDKVGAVARAFAFFNRPN